MNDGLADRQRWLRIKGDTVFTRMVVDRVTELIGDDDKVMDLLKRCAATGVDPIPLAEKYREKRDE